MAGFGVAGIVALATATVCVTSGCSTLGYYAHAVNGHLQLLGSAKPVAQWLADEQSPATLKERLALSQRMRDFAIAELKLPDNASYRRYADLKRGAAVWNVVAAPELSLTLKTWCFPVVGCVGYRGYYDLGRATAFADELHAEGFESGVYAVPAYSTLGALPGDFFADPLLNTFIQFPEGELARFKIRAVGLAGGGDPRGFGGSQHRAARQQGPKASRRRRERARQRPNRYGDDRAQRQAGPIDEPSPRSPATPSGSSASRRASSKPARQQH